MTVLSVELTIRLPHAGSLKDKRQVAKSIIEKTRQRFPVSIAETDTQDAHKTLTLGMAVVSGSEGQARMILDEALRFAESFAEDGYVTRSAYF